MRLFLVCRKLHGHTMSISTCAPRNMVCCARKTTRGPIMRSRCSKTNTAMLGIYSTSSFGSFRISYKTPLGRSSTRRRVPFEWSVFRAALGVSYCCCCSYWLWLGHLAVCAADQRDPKRRLCIQPSEHPPQPGHQEADQAERVHPSAHWARRLARFSLRPSRLREDTHFAACGCRRRAGRAALCHARSYPPPYVTFFFCFFFWNIEYNAVLLFML